MHSRVLLRSQVFRDWPIPVGALDQHSAKRGAGPWQDSHLTIKVLAEEGLGATLHLPLSSPTALLSGHTEPHFSKWTLCLDQWHWTVEDLMAICMQCKAYSTGFTHCLSFRTIYGMHYFRTDIQFVKMLQNLKGRKCCNSGAIEHQFIFFNEKQHSDFLREGMWAIVASS